MPVREYSSAATDDVVVAGLVSRADLQAACSRGLAVGLACGGNLQNSVRTWLRAHEILKAVMWVDFVHDVPGKGVLEAAVQRLDRSQQTEIQ